MTFYEERILPYLLQFVMRNRYLVPYRWRTVSAAEGRVLEIGIGSGLNLPFYRADVTEIFGLDPSPRLITMAKRAAKGASKAVTFIEGSAETIPLDAESVDTVVTTGTLCTDPASR